MFKMTLHCLALVTVVALTGCATPKAYDYTAFRESKPKSILVLPPVNQSPDVRASYGMLSQITMPLAESGYYVFPVAMVDQTFKQNGLENPTDIHAASLEKMRDIFGADAVLYISIDQYGTKYQVINSATIVTAKAKLVDARTNRLLWEGNASASDAEGQNNSGGGIAGLLISAIVKQVMGTLVDNTQRVAGVASARLVHARPGGLLYGPRSPKYQQD